MRMLWSNKPLVTLLGMVGGCLLLVLLMLAMSGGLMSWPLMDEAYALLAVRHMLDGQLPYRDYYDYLPPGSTLPGFLLSVLSGFSVVGNRLLVVMGWLLQLALVYDMARGHLSKGWLLVLMGFLLLTNLRYPIYQHHFWSGLTALVAVYFAWRYLKAVYSARPVRSVLFWSGVFTAATFWMTQSLGVMIALAIGCFSVLHCLLHERQERGVAYHQVSKKDVFCRWWRDWGRFWLLPGLGFHSICLLIIAALGLWHGFLRDAIFWVAGGNYQKATVLGYFVTFYEEFRLVMAPFIDGLPLSLWPMFLYRLPMALHLFLIGLLPVLGILGLGYWLPARFVYRLMRLEDEEWLLWWLSAAALVLSTFSYSTSMHIVSNGAVVYLVAAIALQRLLLHRERLRRFTQTAGGIFLGLVLLGMTLGSLLQIGYGAWLPATPRLPDKLLYTDSHIVSPAAFTNLLQILSQADERGECVFVFIESPSFYLAGNPRNATRFALVIPKLLTEGQRAEMMRDLHKNKPRFVVNDRLIESLHKDPRFRQYKPEELRLPELEAFLARDYMLIAVAGHYNLYARKDTPIQAQQRK